MRRLSILAVIAANLFGFALVKGEETAWIAGEATAFEQRVNEAFGRPVSLSFAGETLEAVTLDAAGRRLGLK